MVKQRVTYLQSRFISCSRQSKVFTYFIIVRAIRRAPVVQSVESAAVQWLHSRASQQQRTLARGQTTQQRAIRTKTFCFKKKNRVISLTIFANAHYTHSGERIFARLICFRVKVTIVIVRCLDGSSACRVRHREHVTPL